MRRAWPWRREYSLATNAAPEREMRPPWGSEQSRFGERGGQSLPPV